MGRSEQRVYRPMSFESGSAEAAVSHARINQNRSWESVAARIPRNMPRWGSETETQRQSRQEGAKAPKNGGRPC